MLNKNLKALSDFLRKEKVSVTLGVCLGLVITINSTGGNLSSNTVTAQAVDATVLTDDDVRNSLSNSIIPSEDELARVESEHVTISVKDSILVTQGYTLLAEEAISTQKDYTEYLEEQERIAEEKRLAEEAERQRKAEEERKRQEELANKNKTATFKVTAYCTCRECCGKYSPEVSGKPASTASGTSPCAGRTVAVDPSVIPLGSTVIINGHSYIAEDTGSAVKGNVIDIYFDTHSEAQNWGCKYLEVTYIIK